MELKLTLNGRAVAASVEADTLLIDFLRALDPLRKRCIYIKIRFSPDAFIYLKQVLVIIRFPDLFFYFGGIGKNHSSFSHIVPEPELRNIKVCNKIRIYLQVYILLK